MAYNGVDGSLLWKRSSRDELFGSAIFQDLNSDGINDVIISGRSAQLLAIDGSNGALLWDFFPYGTNPADSGAGGGKKGSGAGFKLPLAQTNQNTQIAESLKTIPSYSIIHEVNNIVMPIMIG